MMTVDEKVDEYYYIFSEYIEPAQRSIDEASSIGAEVDEAEELLDEAIKALQNGNFSKTQNFAVKALKKAKNADVGSITVKDLLAGAPRYDQRDVIILGTIKFIDMTYGEGYVFAIDDESGLSRYNISMAWAR
ncbi:MAG: hypothetical protein SVM80_05940 [Halobacteriota archaeon]|nr:hypothetical protein [Halobacteriota archaeon]